MNKDILDTLVPGIQSITDPGFRKTVYATWLEAWRRSGIVSPLEAPQSPHAPDRSLFDHTNEVFAVGEKLIGMAIDAFGLGVDVDLVRSALILHDVDKLIIYTRYSDGSVGYSDGWMSQDHGPVGAEIAAEAGAPESLVELVRYHSPFCSIGHLPETVAGLIVHYSDLAAADLGILSSGNVPIFARTKIVKRA